MPLPEWTETLGGSRFWAALCPVWSKTCYRCTDLPYLHTENSGEEISYDDHLSNIHILYIFQTFIINESLKKINLHNFSSPFPRFACNEAYWWYCRLLGEECGLICCWWSYVSLRNVCHRNVALHHASIPPTRVTFINPGQLLHYWWIEYRSNHKLSKFMMWTL